MRSALGHRRSPVFTLTAWLSIALHLLVVSASGWHFHASGGHARADGRAAHTLTSDPACPAHDAHDHTPRDGRDPEGCTTCQAIFALQHSGPPAPVPVLGPLTEAPAETHAQPRARSIAAVWRACARGPPAPAAAPVLSMM